MLLHLVPRLLTRSVEPQCALIDFECPILGLKLMAGVAIVARRPYPNKKYLVVCSTRARRATIGLFVETRERVREFTTICRWAVAAQRIVIHRVQYVVLDEEHDAMTDDMLYWYTLPESMGGFGSRWTSQAADWMPAQAQPRMEIVRSDRRQGNFVDTLDETGSIVERTEMLEVHTVERERLLHPNSWHSDRMPTQAMAFAASVRSTERHDDEAPYANFAIIANT